MPNKNLIFLSGIYTINSCTLESHYYININVTFLRIWLQICYWLEILSIIKIVKADGISDPLFVMVFSARRGLNRHFHLILFSILTWTIWHKVPQNDCVNLPSLRVIKWNPVNTDTEGAIENVCINRVFVLRWVEFRVNVWLFLTGTKQTVHNNEVSVLSGYL